MRKLLITVLTLALLCATLTACGGKTAPAPAAEPAPQETAAEPVENATPVEKPVDNPVQNPVENAEPAEEEEPYTGDASLDDPRNADGIGEKELLVVSFGTSYNDSRRETIGAVEAALEQAFPEWSVRRAFTSQIIIDHVFERDGEVIDNVEQALERAVANGVKTLVVQPTHLMDGFEYNDLAAELATYADAFEHIALGTPLLTDKSDFDAVADAIIAATKEFDDGRTAIAFMGHGTEAESNRVYEQRRPPPWRTCSRR